MNSSRLSLALGFCAHVARRIWHATRAPVRGILAAMLLLYAVAFGAATWELERELARLRAAGARLTFAEVAPPPVPDAENAALLYDRAYARLPRLERFDPSDPSSSLCLAEPDSQILSDFLSSNREKRRGVSLLDLRRALTGTEDALALVHQATRMPRCRFPVDWEAGGMAIFPHFPRLRAFSRLLAANAVVAATEGRSAEAVADLEAMIGMAGHIGAEPHLIGQFVQYHCLHAFGVSLQRVLSNGPLEGNASYRLEEALASVDLYTPFEVAMRAEVAVGRWAPTEARRNPGLFICNLGSDDEVEPEYRFLKATLRLSEPLLRHDEALYLHYMSTKIARSQDRRPALESEIRAKDSNEPEISIIGMFLYRLDGSMDIQKRDEAATRIALARCALAKDACHRMIVECYNPLTSELAKPRPDDPYTGRPFQYRMHGQGYRIYSVGPNGRDDGGNHWRDRPTLNYALPHGEEDDIAWTVERPNPPPQTKSSIE